MDISNVFDHRGEFFRVLQETGRSQTAVMTIAPGADAGPAEEHEGDQIIYIIEGEARLRVGSAQHRAPAGALVIIPAKTPHHVSNAGRTPLFMLTVYAPPEY
jgi:mannose-6-phosphate isomerase-like protein (cupin superfamily)